MTDAVHTAALRRGVIPYLNLEGASDAAVLYGQAFAAKELSRMPAEDGKRLMHCELEINGGSLMISDCFPEYGHGHQPSHSFTMTLVVEDIDAWWTRAVEAGLEVVMPVQLMFWGDRYGQLRDRFGVRWALNAPVTTA